MYYNNSEYQPTKVMLFLISVKKMSGKLLASLVAP